MKRDDETLLEYLIRLAKEGGEGLQGLGAERLKKARTDVAARRGLLDDEVVEEAVIEEPFPFQQIDGPRPFEEPQPIQEWTGVGPAPEADPALMQRMLTQPGQTDIAREQWTGVGPLPGETKSLMDLDQSMTGMREQPAQQDLPSPLTSRMPTADIAPRDANLSPDMLAAKEHYEKLQGATVADSPTWQEPDIPEGEKGSPHGRFTSEGFLDKADAFMSDPFIGPTGIFRGIDAIIGKKGWEGFKKDTGLDINLLKAGEYRKFFGIDDEKETNTEALNSVVSSIDNALKKKDSSKKAPSTEQVEKTVDKTLTKKEGKTTFDGYNSKADFFKSMGLTAKGKDYFDRMDKIDNESNMFSMIAMLGGAGNSRAGTNFRNKSYQRIRAEMEMDQREWDRAYKLFSHPWVTYYDEAGLRDPVNRPVGAGPPEGGGWSRGTRPPKDPQLTPQTRVINEIKALYTGEESLDEIMLRLTESDPLYGMDMDMERANERSANKVKVLLGLDYTPWTPKEKRQVRGLMSAGKVNDVLKWIMEKSGDPTKPYIPYDLKEEFEIFWKANKNKATDSFMEGMLYPGRTPKAN